MSCLCLGLLFSPSVFKFVCLLFYWRKQLESPRCDSDPPAKCTGKTAVLCISMVDSLWLTILDALSLILSRYDEVAI